MAGLSFGAPLFLWGLLSIPLLWLIHALQRKHRPQLISTLFLLDSLPAESLRGSRWQRLLSSKSLWLQTLALLLLILLAIDLRWDRELPRYKLAIVVDHSASMGAFSKKLPEELLSALKAWDLLKPSTEFSLYASSLELGLRYRGQEISPLLEATKQLSFDDGEHDVSPMLRLARQWLGPQGSLVYVTDHVQKMPSEIYLVGIGELVENVGFSGSRVQTEAQHWTLSVMVRNSSGQAQKRELALDDQAAEKLTLQPREMKTLTWSFPKDKIWTHLKLSSDAFEFDDELTVVQPYEKNCCMAIDSQLNDNASLHQALERLAPEAVWSGNQIHLSFEQAEIKIHEESTQRATKPADSHRIVFYASTKPVESSPLAVVGSRHEVVRGLTWGAFGLSVTGLGNFELQTSDEVLVYFQQNPLVVLRTVSDIEGHSLLELHINMEHHQILWEHPAFVLMIHRYLELVKSKMQIYERRNIAVPSLLEIPFGDSSPLELFWDDQSSPELLAWGQKQTAIALRLQHQRLRLSQAHRECGAYAFQMSDAREGDFQLATSFRQASSEGLRSEGHSTFAENPLKILWAFMVLSALLLDWHFRQRPS